ncbi:MAG: serine/threonine protein kinase [Bacteroidota bacterium]
MNSSRRNFLKSSASAVSFLAFTGCSGLGSKSSSTPLSEKRFFFTSQGKTGMMNADGTGLRYLTFDVPNQATWQPGGFLPDGHRVIMLSMEPRRDGPGKPFNEYYHTTPTHIWIHDLDSGSLTEIVTKERLAPFITPQLLLKDGRLLIQVIRDKVPQTFNINLDGSDPRPFTQPGEGMPYGMSLSPDGSRVAYHLASTGGYEIRTSDVEGNNISLVIKTEGHVYFGPKWSPDGEWLIFQDCNHEEDPGHDWSDMVLSRPDGSDLQHLTEGQVLWFAATYGSPGNRGSGSNQPVWSKDGTILFSRRLPHSKTAWEFQKNRVDVDHFNRDFKPDLAQGGTEICRMDPHTGITKRLTQSDPPVWDFRNAESSDGEHILFCRAETGGSSGLWIMDSDGSNQRLLTRGVDNLGADHPRWIP